MLGSGGDKHVEGKWMDGWMDAVCELVMGHNAAESVSQC